MIDLTFGDLLKIWSVRRSSEFHGIILCRSCINVIRRKRDVRHSCPRNFYFFVPCSVSIVDQSDFVTVWSSNGRKIEINHSRIVCLRLIDLSFDFHKIAFVIYVYLYLKYSFNKIDYLFMYSLDQSNFFFNALSENWNVRYKRTTCK